MASADHPDQIDLDAAAVTDGVTNLVSKSLVALDTPRGGTRWYLLETIRAYALEKLAKRDGWLLWIEFATVLPPWDTPVDFQESYFQGEGTPRRLRLVRPLCHDLRQIRRQRSESKRCRRLSKRRPPR